MIQSLENHLELPYKHKDKPKFYLIILYLCAFLRQICLCSSIDMLISALFIIITKTGSNSISIKNTIVIHTKKHNNKEWSKNEKYWVILNSITRHKKSNKECVIYSLIQSGKKNRQISKSLGTWQR